ncbi:hypothetical protein G6M78_08305 [Agrobacterium tumefaciens]|uniref:hypothetical protein n=1 Tax=Agrobacterium tumefaciens TaxID=358 RepID=UPI001571A8B1|nr:hypothetical protein [Agrobacterium tumefaciens]NTE55081.1 hypothetical protein [Agrobacterium tumefaciens]NTE73849.1 hypothetical protein [Agrobacterium tumefaciens]
MSANATATVTLSLIDKVTGPIKRLGARLSGLGKKLGLDRIGKQAASVGRGFQSLAVGIGRSTGRLAAFTALAGGVGGGTIAALFGMAKGTATLGKEIERLSQVAGVTPDIFQRWAFAAKTVGIEQDKIADILKDVGDKVGDYLQNDGGPLKDFFDNVAKKAGVTKKSFKGLSSSEALQLYVRSLEKANLSQSEMTFYMEAIANDATLLLPLLRGNAAELKRLGIVAGKTGNILGQSALDASGKFLENLQALMARISGLRNYIAVQLIPTFDSFVVKLTELYDANVDLIRLKVGEWLTTIRKFMRDLLDPASDLRKSIAGIASRFAEFGDKVKPFVDFIGGPMNAALAALALWIAGPIIGGVLSLTAAFVKLGAVILATPFGWIALAIGAVVAAVYVLYQKWDEFVAYFTSAWGRIKEAFDKGFVQGITAVLEEFNPVVLIAKGINAVFEYFTGIDLIAQGKALMESLFEGIRSMDFVQALVSTVSGWWAAYEAWWNSFSGNVRGAGAAIVTALWDGLKSKWEEMVAWVRSAIAELMSYLPEAIQTRLGFNVSGTVAPAANAATNAVNAGTAVGAMFNAPANSNAPGGSSGSGGPQIVAGDTNTTTSVNATINVTAKTDANPGDIGAAVRRELDGVAKRAAAVNGSRLND